MLTHEQLIAELMKRPGVKTEVERLEREEGALLDKQIQAHQAISNSNEAAKLLALCVAQPKLARTPSNTATSPHLKMNKTLQTW
jgi:hypothetical protein